MFTKKKIHNITDGYLRRVLSYVKISDEVIMQVFIQFIFFFEVGIFGEKKILDQVLFFYLETLEK